MEMDVEVGSLALLFHIRQALGSNLGPQTSHTERFLVFFLLYSFQANSEIVLYNLSY
jgi:hypothetical protein